MYVCVTVKTAQRNKNSIQNPERENIETTKEATRGKKMTNFMVSFLKDWLLCVINGYVVNQLPRMRQHKHQKDLNTFRIFRTHTLSCSLYYDHHHQLP